MSLEGLAKYVEQADSLLQMKGIRKSDIIAADTVCYDAPSNDRYDELKAEFGQSAALIEESMVNDRLIAVFEFHDPLIIGNQALSYLELPQPKRPQTPEGIAHVQYVTRQGISRFKNRYSALNFEEKGNVLNRLLQLSGDGVTVRFHDKHMGAVIDMERINDWTSSNNF